MSLHALFNEKIECSLLFGGANHWYGLRMRPFSIGAQPKNTSAYLDNELAKFKFNDAKDPVNFRHGAIAYANALTPKEIDRYELVPLDINSASELVLCHNTDELTVASVATFVIDKMIKETFNTSKLTWEMYDKWADDIGANGLKFMDKWFRAHPSFLNRKEDAAQFKAFLILKKTIDFDDLNDVIIDNYLS